MIAQPLESEPPSPERLPAAARANIAPFMVMDVMSASRALAASGRDVFHLEVG
jgi:hypothetical protein